MNALYDSLRTSALVVRRESGLATINGPDRASWLQGMVSNDVARLKPGEGCYAAHLNPRGKVLSLMVVLADPEHLWLQLDQDVGQSVAELDKLLIMEDAEVSDRSAEFAVLSVVGAGARGAVEAWAGMDLELRGTYSHSMSGPIRVVRAELGYDLIVPRADVEAVLRALVQCGIPEANGQMWDLLTLEAGIPRYGIDVDETTTLPELGEKGIDYQKGCYIGQEVVAKIKYIGHVNRNLVGLKLTGSDVPVPRSLVEGNNKNVGYITRAAYSPRVDAVIALAFLKLGNQKPGTQVEVLTDGEKQSAEVSSLPFINHFGS
jgi:folate-binding protein YgfZ